MSAVKAEGVGRVYKDKSREFRALDGVDLDIEVGEVRGLLGPNGAGKTTLVKILSTVLIPTEGKASVMGHDVVTQTAAVRPLIGIVFGGDRGLHYGLTPRETLEYWAALYDVPLKRTRQRIGELLERVGLTERANQRVETFSRGMKQRLHLARGLISDAKVLFLDEPTVGMDPLAARDFRNLVRELKGEGRTILITTHDMAEAEAVCDRVALIDRGKMLAVETPPASPASSAATSGSTLRARSCPWSRPCAATPPSPPSGETAPGAYRIEIAEADALRPILSLLVGAGVTAISTSRPSLEEVYVHLIGDRGLQV